MRSKYGLIGLILVVSIMGWASVGITKPSDEYCYIPPKFINVPKKGAGVVFPAKGEVVGNMIKALGENFSHIITVESLDGTTCSHTTFVPDTIKQTTSCDLPLSKDSLRFGWPGVQHKKPCYSLANHFGARGDGVYIWQDTTNGCSFSASRYEIRYHGNRNFNTIGGCSGYADMNCGWNVKSVWNYDNGAIDRAYNQVWDTTYNICLNKSWSGFMKFFASIIGCSKTEACRHAASQVANEFLYGGWDNNVKLPKPHTKYSHMSPASPDKLYHAAKGRKAAEKTKGKIVKCDSL